MADFVFNIAKGRLVELYNRVDTNDPANSALIVVPVLTAGLESDATLKDKDDLAAVFSGATDEATTGNWARKTLTDADLTAASPDDTNDRFDVGAGIANLTWLNVSGGAISKLVFGYDSDTTAGADSAIIPLAAFDFAITPDGSDVTATINTAGIFRAS